MKTTLLTSLVLAATACAFNASLHKSPGAPDLPPSSFAEVLRKPPTGATQLATLEAQGNNWQTVSDCEAKLVIEARKVGANAVLIQPEEAGLGQGAKCSGTAYLVK